MAEVNIESAKGKSTHEITTKGETNCEYETDSEVSFSNTVSRCIGGSEISEDSISISGGPEDESYGVEVTANGKRIRKFLCYAQQFFLFLCWLTSTYFLMAHDEAVQETVTLSVPQDPEGLKYSISKVVHDTSLSLRIYGPFTKTSFRFDELQSAHQDTPHLALSLYKLNANGDAKKIGHLLNLHLEPMKSWENPKVVVVEKIVENINSTTGKYMLHFLCHHCEHNIAIQMDYGFTMISKKSGLILAIILLVLLYMHIMFELVHRTLAGVICCTLGVGIIAAVHMRPPLQVIFNEWGNVSTLMAFFGVSIVVEILAETGLQDYLAAITYELAHGHIWPMLHILLLATCLLSNVFSELLLVLLIAPICLRLCEVMNLNCTPVLSCFIVAINVGATLTPMSSLSNNLISKSPLIPVAPIAFGEFVLHMLPAMLLTLAQSYLHLRILYHDSDKMRSFEPLQVRRLKHLIQLWRIAFYGMGDYTLDDRYARRTVRKRIVSLRKRLQRIGRMPEKPPDFEERVQQLRNNYPIKNMPLLMICMLALVVTLLFSIFSVFSDFVIVCNSWIAILAALLLLSLTCYKEIEGLLTRIDWATMLFFVTLSIIMEVLISLGLLENVGFFLENCIVNVPQQHRLMVAILSIIWISALLTTFIDNVPVADMMLRIIATLAINQDMHIPLMPMVWSLALGCTLGGTGSLVGAFANIACAGVASRHGFSLTFFGYFKIGFLVMLGNIFVTSAYLLLAHVVFEWH